MWFAFSALPEGTTFEADGDTYVKHGRHRGDCTKNGQTYVWITPSEAYVRVPGL